MSRKLLCYLYVLFYVLWPSYVVFKFGGVWINPIRFTILIILIVWAIDMLHNKSLRRILLSNVALNRYLVLNVFVFYLLGFVSAFYSGEFLVSFQAAVLQFLTVFFMMLVSVTYLTSSSSLYYFVRVLLFSILVVQLIGLVEYVTQRAFFSMYIDPASEIAQRILEGKIRDGQFRTMATFSNPLSYAENLVFVFPLAFYFFMYGKRIVDKFIGFAHLLFIPVSMLTTGSRAGLLLLAVSAVICLYILFSRFSKYQREALSLAAIGLMIVGGVYLNIVDTISMLVYGNGGSEASSQARVDQLVGGFVAWLQSPFVGYGMHQGANFISGSTVIDNYYLTALLEKGTFGLVFLLLMQKKIYVTIKSLVIKNKALSMKSNYFFYLAIGLSFINLFVFELVLSIVDIFSVAFMMLGVLIVANANHVRGLNEKS